MKQNDLFMVPRPSVWLSCVIRTAAGFRTIALSGGELPDMDKLGSILFEQKFSNNITLVEVDGNVPRIKRAWGNAVSRIK